MMRITRRNMLKGSGASLAAILAAEKSAALRSPNETTGHRAVSYDDAIGGEENAPPNTFPDLTVDPMHSTITWSYNGQTLLSGKINLLRSGTSLSVADAGFAIAYPGHDSSVEKTIYITVLQAVGLRDAKEAVLRVVCYGLSAQENLEFEGIVSASDEAFPAESFGQPQINFPLVRTSSGVSQSLRNNAIYDRSSDWLLSTENGSSTRIRPADRVNEVCSFRLEAMGTDLRFNFRPRYYQKHKNLSFFEPWQYQVWQKPVQGWCSWWAYFDDVKESDVHKTADAFHQKLLDFGYEYIQIDSGYPREYSGLPADWLETNAKFPDGLAALARYIGANGMIPGIWVNVHQSKNTEVLNHSEWFLSGRDGKPYNGPWIEFGIDGMSSEAIDALVRPLYRGLHQAGWRYVKIDTLRHLLYDSLYPTNSWRARDERSLQYAFRNVLNAAREELGRDTYILASWGVLPETVGIVDGQRLGGDGFGPSTLVQYNSWNNIVWRNDPDHVNLNVPGEEIIRPVLVSMAGAQLLLSDKAEFYQDDVRLEGALRSSPVLVTQPGQIYDFDPSKTDNLVKNLRNANGGADAGPLDADQWGVYCPWWLLEVNRVFESWLVLAHMSWQDLPAATVHFADLGLPAEREYAVYEFWSKKFIGICESSFDVSAQAAKETKVFAIRPVLSHPQILSTNRHISQGGVDLVTVEWSERDNSLRGESEVVKTDRYEIRLRVPKRFQLKHATMDDQPAQVSHDGELVSVAIVPNRTGKISWNVEFS